MMVLFPLPLSPTCAYVSIRQHTSAYVSIRQHTSAFATATFAYQRDCLAGPHRQTEVLEHLVPPPCVSSCTFVPVKQANRLEHRYRAALGVRERNVVEDQSARKALRRRRVSICTLVLGSLALLVQKYKY